MFVLRNVQEFSLSKFLFHDEGEKKKNIYIYIYLDTEGHPMYKNKQQRLCQLLMSYPQTTASLSKEKIIKYKKFEESCCLRSLLDTKFYEVSSITTACRHSSQEFIPIPGANVGFMFQFIWHVSIL